MQQSGLVVDAPANILDSLIKDQAVQLGAHAPRKLGEIGIRTYRDLLQHFPRRYEDRRQLPSWSMLKQVEAATVAGVLRSRKGTSGRRGIRVLRASLASPSGETLPLVWFNQPWLEKQIHPGQRLIVTGTVRLRGSRPELHVQDFEIDDDKESLSTGRITPVYPTTPGLSQAYLRRCAHQLIGALGIVPDHLPRSLLERLGLVSLGSALRAIHFPDEPGQLADALRRLKFDEFLFLELRVLLNRNRNAEGRAVPLKREALEEFLASLPFPMTGAQARVTDELLVDMASGRRMARLLQGDVGSGKTAVAAALIFAVARAGLQAAMMAPTEILAGQHFRNLQQYLFPLGIRTELLTGSMPAAVRRQALARISGGEADLVVGTHALIQDGVEFRDLGLAVIDEEHRFGVEQRRRLIGSRADVLVMSATPIPRSLALTWYGDLDLSVIDELPPGRTPVVTRLMSASGRRDAYRFAWQHIRAGRQAYVVTPLVEDSEALDEVVSSEGLYGDLQQIMPADCRIGLLHGRMPAADKEAVMDSFRHGEIDMLVSTTVIEVGVDVANATVMIIENAERFGLAQLHQLRGRVGRGAFESHCLLIAGDASRKTRERLEIIAGTQDGHEIAEHDLRLRGPGELRGTRQSGQPDLLLGDLTKDLGIIEEARDIAMKILEADPRLEARWAGRLAGELRRRVAATGVRELI